MHRTLLLTGTTRDGLDVVGDKFGDDTGTDALYVIPLSFSARSIACVANLFNRARASLSSIIRIISTACEYNKTALSRSPDSSASRACDKILWTFESDICNWLL